MGDLVEAVSWDPSGLGLDRRNGRPKPRLRRKGV